MKTDLTNTAINEAQAILKSECSPIGLMASPEGYTHQAWSAGMYVFARHFVTTVTVPLISDEVPEGSAHSHMIHQASLKP